MSSCDSDSEAVYDSDFEPEVDVPVTAKPKIPVSESKPKHVITIIEPEPQPQIPVVENPVSELQESDDLFYDSGADFEGVPVAPVSEVPKFRKIKTLVSQPKTKIPSLKTQYEAIKKIVEKEYFWCKGDGEFYRISPDDGIARLYKQRSVVTALKCYKLQAATKKTIDFYTMWVEDPTRRAYERLVFEPNPKALKEGDYNTFRGLKWKDGLEPDMDLIRPFLDLISDMVNGVPEHIEFFLDWLSWIVQTPWKKTDVAILLYSPNQGVGKNTIVEYIERLLGEEHTAKLPYAEAIGARFNSLYSEKLLVYGDEINAKARKLTDQVKNAITETKMVLEEKHVNARMSKNYANFIFTTNNSSTFKIEQSDRRWFAVECLHPGRRDCRLLYERLHNDEVIQSLYSFLKNRTIKNISSGMLVPVTTEYKQDLQTQSLPAYVLYLFDNYDVMCEGYPKRRMPVKDYFDAVNRYAEGKHLAKIQCNRTIPKWIREELGEIATLAKSNVGAVVTWKSNEEIREFLRRLNPILAHATYDDEEKPGPAPSE